MIATLLLLSLLPLLSTAPDPHLCGENSADQLTRISIQDREVILELEYDLAEFPAESLRREIDRDRNGTISPREERSWLGRSARKKVSALKLWIDGTILPLRCKDAALTLGTRNVGPFPLRFHLKARGTLQNEPKKIRFRNESFSTYPGFIRAYLSTPAGITAQPVTALPQDLAKFENLNQDINQSTGSADPLPRDQWPPTIREITWQLTRGKGPTGKALPIPPAIPKANPEKSPPPATNWMNQEFIDFFFRVKTGDWESIFLLLAFLYGAGHALSPGHGKAITGAFLVGHRGTIWDAILLGIIVTITHTLMVFSLGLAYAYMGETINRGSIGETLNVISSLMIVGIGGFLIRVHGRRLLGKKGKGKALVASLLTICAIGTGVMLIGFNRPHLLLCTIACLLVWAIWLRLAGRNHGHEHQHEHDHGDHHHGPGGHSHDIPLDQETGRPRLWQVLSLGVSGGIVPCPTGLVIVALAASTGNPELGLLLVTLFSLGMALVLVGIGIGAVKGVGLVLRYGGPRAEKAFLAVPFFSALFITALGLWLTWIALITTGTTN